jgi:uncharacterized protein (DUF488 family)
VNAHRQGITFYTIGHSTRSFEAFSAMLASARIGLVADVRTVPRSRANPQFNIDRLPGQLAGDGIDYAHLPPLGGLRGVSKQVPPATNAYWINQSFHNYADYAMSEEFHMALEDLRAVGRQRTTVIMCAEAVWWRCHRRIIADYLIAAGERVFHIMAAGRIEPAEMNPAARRMPDGTLSYPAAEEGEAS